MKIGIVGTGAVGQACALSVVLRGSARELVLVNRSRQRAKAVATDMLHGTPLVPAVDVRDGDYQDLAGAILVMITAGINEKTGGATNRADPTGRLRLLETNAKLYEEVVPQIVKAVSGAVILVVTDPPDPLADLTRELAGHDRILSTGTFLDSLRFRVHLAQRLKVNAASVEATVIGEHGTSEVLLWSFARIAGVPVGNIVRERGEDFEAFRNAVEHDVRYANIAIIEGNDASQFGIGIISARIAEAIVRDEHLAIPIGSYQERFGVTLSLPTVIGRQGVVRVLEPVLSEDERIGLQRSADKLKQAFAPKKAA